VPAAAPPLGFTARVMFALAMMGLGAVTGYIVGRVLGREKIEPPVRMRGFGKSADAQPSFEMRRPINAAEDLGEPLDAPVAEEAPLRRRPLSLSEDLSPAIPSESAPLPGGLPWERAHAAEFAAEIAESKLPHSMAATDPLALDVLLEEANAAEHAPFAEPLPAEAPPIFAEADPVADLVSDKPAETQPEILSTAELPDEPPFAPMSTPSNVQAHVLQAHAVAATPIDRAPLDSLGLVQLIERLALAISRRTSVAEAPERIAAPEFVISAPAPQPSIPRFESSSVAATSVLPDMDEAEDDVSVAPRQTERVVQLRPSTLQPVQAFGAADTDLDGDEEAEDLGLDRFLRMSPLLTRNRAPVQDVQDGDVIADDLAPEPEVVEDLYPSLLDMGPVAARREPLRIDDSAGEDADATVGIEPVVVFPRQESPLQAGPSQSNQAASNQARPFERPSIMPLPGSPLASPGRAAPSAPIPSVDDIDMAAAPSGLPDAEEADRALRAALATLQRMTAQG
ncbi:MAG: hypothetical protein C0409_12410, partial [Novosphingobium sp.]|nr:hypothetical protein [Novosphingobium sp.]